PLRAHRAARHGLRRSVGRYRQVGVRDPWGPGRRRRGARHDRRVLGVGRPHHAPTHRASGVPTMSRLMVLMFFVAWAGFTMVLAEVRWFRRPSLVARLHAYLPSPARSTTPARPRGHE